MGKVHDKFPEDLEAVTQWLARKIKNHDPMSVREHAFKGSRTAVTARLQVVGKDTVMYSTCDGQRFKFVVSEVDPPTEPRPAKSVERALED